MSASVLSHLVERGSLGAVARRSLAAFAALAIFSTSSGQAASGRPIATSCPGQVQADQSSTGRDAELVIDGQSGQVLYERNASAERHPASLTKMMTLYLLFDALKARQMTLQSQLTISRHAASQLKVNLSLSPGMTMSVETAIKAVVVRSANDVAVAIAEAVGGTESHFAEMMTAKARELGMRDTFYHNASGLPDPLQITTASDLSILARHLAYDFPQYYPYFATPNFIYHGMTYYTHDNLLGRFKGTDGIKTGYTNASGFNLVSSVVRDGAHVIGVVMGGDTARQRDDEMVRLLSATFVRVQANPSLVTHGTIPWKSPVHYGSAAAIAAPCRGTACAGHLRIGADVQSDSRKQRRDRRRRSGELSRGGPNLEVDDTPTCLPTPQPIGACNRRAI